MVELAKRGDMAGLEAHFASPPREPSTGIASCG